MNNKHISQFRLTLACLAVLAGMLAAGLWPFNFRTDNHVAPLPGGGLKFSAPSHSSKSDLGGMVFTALPLKCPASADCRKDELSLEIGLAADSEANSCLKRILDVRRPDGSEAFYVGQWKSSFIIRTFTSPLPAGKPYREIGVRDVLAAGRQSMVTVTSNGAGIDIYVDGSPEAQYPGFHLLQGGQTLEGHRLYLGNAPDLNCPWAGEIFGLFVYGRALTPEEECISGGRREGCEGSGAFACWTFGAGEMGEIMEDLSGSRNALWMPRDLVFEKQFLGWADLQNISRSDLTLNLIGFVPFGFLLSLRVAAARRMSTRSCGLAALVIGLGVSLLIETAQVFLPGRDSSLMDLAANTVGTAAGAMMALMTIKGKSAH